VKNASGKFVIIAIVAVAVAAAGASWWFRYSATNRAAEYWDPIVARLIRDAPVVELYKYDRLPNAAFLSEHESYLDVGAGRDISHAPGLVHLRSALLEDRSFSWPPEDMKSVSWGWVLVFRESPRGLAVMLHFTSDWSYVAGPNHQRMLSCRPIAAGLAKFVNELPPPAAENAR
jgi:hypothetical protein